MEDKIKCCSDENSRPEGTSRLTRFLKILDPVNAPLDNSTPQDILVFAKRYAGLVRFFDENEEVTCIDKYIPPVAEQKVVEHREEDLPHQAKENNIKQVLNSPATWKEFFYSDIAVVIASISQYEKKLSAIKQDYAGKRDALVEHPVKENCSGLFKTIIALAHRINEWYSRSIDMHPLKIELKLKIKSSLSLVICRLIAYEKGIKKNTGIALHLKDQYEVFRGEPWSCNYDAIDSDNSINIGNSDKKKNAAAVLYIDDIFNEIVKVYEYLIGRSQFYWNEAIENYPSHQPHMALFIAFVELFSLAQNELNKITQRHLDFYYRDVLQLKEKPAQADSVYLIYELAKDVVKYDLPPGTALSAGKDNTGKELIYKTEKDIVLNGAIVKELKTVFLDKKLKAKGDSTKGSDFKIEKIYAASAANSSDGNGGKFTEPETAWPTFGYADTSIKDSVIPGTEAGIGFAIASPQLFLEEGTRYAALAFHLNKVNEIDASSVLAEFAEKNITILKSDAFDISFSGKKEWIKPIEEMTPAAVAMPKRAGIKLKGDKIVNEVKNKAGALQFAELIGTLEKILKIDLTELKDIIERARKDLDLKNPASIKSKAGKKARAESTIKEDAQRIISEWQLTNKIIVSLQKGNFNWLLFLTHIKDEQDAIVGYDSKVLGPNFQTNFPVCKLTFNSQYKNYEWLRDTSVTDAAVGVAVIGLKDMTLFNDDGPINFKNPFKPFSSIPKVGSAFYIGSEEVFYKSYGYPIKDKFYSINIDIDWMVPVIGKETLNTNFFVRQKKNWILQNDDNKPIDLFRPISTILSFKEFYARENDHSYFPDKEKCQAGFIKYELYEIPEWMFPSEEIKIPTVDEAGARTSFSVNIPGTPVIPEIKSIKLNYVSLQRYENNIDQFFHIYPFGNTEIWRDDLAGAGANRVQEFINDDIKVENLIVNTNLLLPQFKFEANDGSKKKIEALNKISKNYFHINQYESDINQQGNLYIGIENLSPPQNISLLFKFADGTAYDNDNDPPKINWSYLSNNEWIPLPEDHILSDTTYGFQTTGIMLIDFPEDATKNNSLLTNNLHWLCASVSNYADRIPELIDVIAQANVAKFYDQQNDKEHYRNPLPAKSISKLVTNISQIKTIVQPFESFDGKMREEGKVYYTRVSERLRHKARAITPWDYEHLLLEQFPSVYKIKTLTHTDPNCLCRHKKSPPGVDDCCCAQVAPGHVLIVPVSNLRNKSAIDNLKPRTGRLTLIRMEEFLQKRVSPFVKVHAKNPKYEEVRVSFNVKFNSGADKGYFKRKLNEDIIQYLTPWRFDSNIEILFGAKIYASKIINFIEERDYVNYITCFRMIHVNENCCETDNYITCEDMQQKDLKGQIAKRFLNEISASSKQAILVSAKHHCINLIDEKPEPDDCHCKK